MIYEKPDYFDSFHCIADKCPDTCCIGWEVDVDDESVEYYQTDVDGSIGEKLKSVMHIFDEEELNDHAPGEAASFPLKEDGRCPFLDDNHLCELYSALGEEGFCQTCREYPRYYGEACDYEQWDLSLSCPEVARIFLQSDKPVTYIRTEDIMETYEASEDDKKRLKEILSWRDQLLKSPDILQMIFQYNEDDDRLITRLLKLEILDDRWTETLQAIKEYLSDAAHHNSEESAEAVQERNNAVLFEKYRLRTAQYFIFRYALDVFYSSSKEDVLRLTARSMRTIELMYRAAVIKVNECDTLESHTRSDSHLGLLADVMHLYSRQVEHSEDNVEIMKQNI